MTDNLSKRRVRGAKLGMTVEAPKKPGPYDKLGARMEAGSAEEERLEERGRRIAGRQAAKTQGRIPQVRPSLRKGGARA
jgi:hypothetical protein